MKAFSFFENWFQLAESQTDDAKRLAFYDAVMRYAFDGEEPENVGRRGDGAKRAAYFAFLTVQPVLELSRKRAAAGSTGGRPRVEKQAEKQTEKQTEKQRGKAKNARLRKEENRIEENRKESSPARERARPTQSQFVDGCVFAGIPKEFAAGLFEEVSTNGWEDRDGRPIGNWRMYAKRIWNDQRTRPADGAGHGDVAPTIVSMEDL